MELGGTRPEFCDVLERLAQQVDPGARVWRGLDLPAAQQHTSWQGGGSQLNQKLADHDTLLSRISLVVVQSAWALLNCAGARANYMLRVVRPELVHDFAEEMLGTHHPHKCGSRWNSESNSIPASGRNGSA